MVIRKLLGIVWLFLAVSGIAGAQSWNIATVGSGEHSSLAVDGEGKMHVAIYDFRDGTLKYASRDGDNWAMETVDGPGYTGQYPSLVFDPDGKPHISYYDYQNGDLKYASRIGSSWTKETVDSAGNVGLFSSLVIDSHGSPHISYYDYGNGRLKHAFILSGKWQSEVVDSVGDVGQYSSIALDSAGNPMIGYYDYSQGDLKCSRWTGTQWLAEAVDSVGDVGQYASLAADRLGNPHISYYDSTNGRLKYAVRAGSAWTMEVVDDAPSAGQGTSLVLDPSGAAHIGYYDYDNHDLRYALRLGIGWMLRTVDTGGDVGQNTSICLDAAGSPHISYFDGINGRVKAANVAPVKSVSVAKKADDGSLFSVDGQVVTAVFDGFFYIESLGRSSGIRVDKAMHGLSVGQEVGVFGAVMTNGDGERYISAASARPSGFGTVNPLGMNNRALGGTDLGFDAGRFGQRGVVGGSGPNNIGLLVKVCGVVTQTDPGGSYFYIDDGSGLRDGTRTGDEENVGVRIASDGRDYKNGPFVSVTGVSSCFRTSPAGGSCRVVRVRSVSDLGGRN